MDVSVFAAKQERNGVSVLGGRDERTIDVVVVHGRHEWSLPGLFAESICGIDVHIFLIGVTTKKSVIYKW